MSKKVFPIITAIILLCVIIGVVYFSYSVSISLSDKREIVKTFSDYTSGDTFGASIYDDSGNLLREIEGRYKSHDVSSNCVHLYTLDKEEIFINLGRNFNGYVIVETYK